MQGETAPPAQALAVLQPSLTGVCKDYLTVHRRKLEALIDAGRGGVDVARAHARAIDGLIGAIWCAVQGAMRPRMRRMPRVAVAGVGGYGRRLVGLRSDVDVVFLCEDPDDAQVRMVTEGLLYPLWDAGLSLGHAVRGVSDTLRLARTDLRTATTLLDVRCVAGDAELCAELVHRGWSAVFEPDLPGFLDRLRAEAADRHERFGGSLFLLEPEIKQGRGGLRDVDIALWAVKARWHVGSFDELVRTGGLSARELSELSAAHELLWRVRHVLHRKAGRRQDRLTFEDQEECARQLGFEDADDGLGVERFMQSYYRHARAVARLGDMLVERACPPRRRWRQRRQPLDADIILFEERVTFEDSSRLEEDPALALRLYRHVVASNAPPYGYARDAIARASADPAWCARLRESESARDDFVRLVCRAAPAPVPKGSLLSELHDVGLLVAMIPEFGPVTGRVQHDVYHVYTVDVHSIAAVDRLRALQRGDLAKELPLPSQLAAEITRPAPLYLGLLLHDIGKAHGKDHAKRGAGIARAVAERLGTPKADAAHVEWLVSEHLVLYHTATRRDTSDPETIADFGRAMGGMQRLHDLYLLTIADLSTTNPGAMTSWKARMLDDLFVATERWLEQGGAGFAHERAEAVRDEVLTGLDGEGAASVRSFIRDMPERYLLSNSVDAIRFHALAARDRADLPVHAAMRGRPTPETAELVLVTDDRPGLLGDLAAALTANRLEIVDAQIFVREREDGVREAVDAFHVRKRSGGALVADDVLPKLTRDLHDVVTRATTAEALLARSQHRGQLPRRRDPDVPTEIRVENAVSAGFTVVDVFTRDRPGLLCTIARTLAAMGLSIALSKVNTEGARAADVFYVTDAGGRKLADAALLGRIAIRLREAIQSLDGPSRT